MGTEGRWVARKKFIDQVAERLVSTVPDEQLSIRITLLKAKKGFADFDIEICDSSGDALILIGEARDVFVKQSVTVASIANALRIDISPTERRHG